MNIFYYASFNIFLRLNKAKKRNIQGLFTLAGDTPHQFTVTGKPGKHYVTVELRYSMPGGSIMAVNKKLEYIIAEEK